MRARKISETEESQKEELSLRRQPAFVPQRRDYGESRGLLGRGLPLSDYGIASKTACQEAAAFRHGRVAELVFWAIVEGQEVLREESQPPVRAKPGATWVP